MIIEFKVANYRSINTEQTLSFVAESARRHPDNLTSRPSYKLLKTVALFGANASGKSNFVKAIGAMQAFVRDSATRMNDGDPIAAAQPYRLNPATREAPSRFEIMFVTNGIIYIYGFAASRERIREEWLTAKRETTEAIIYSFRRIFNDRLGKDEWEFEGFKKADASQIMDRTLENMLALSVGAQQKVEILRPAYRYLRQNLWTFDLSDDPEMLLMATARLCHDSEEKRQKLSLLLSAADTGVEDIRIETAMQGKITDVKPEFPEHVQDFINAVNKFVASSPTPRITAQRRDNNGNMVGMDFLDDESQGTQRFFAIAGPLLDALAEGAFIAIDELDASMHPLLTRRLLEVFQSSEANQSGAQLLFTTHDSSLLDEDLFRRDQIWLAEKCDGASTFFTLADIRPPVRNTESFLRNYLTGRYGGTPHLGRAFDDLAAGSRA